MMAISVAICSFYTSLRLHCVLLGCPDLDAFPVVACQFLSNRHCAPSTCIEALGQSYAHAHIHTNQFVSSDVASFHGEMVNPRVRMARFNRAVQKAQYYHCSHRSVQCWHVPPTFLSVTRSSLSALSRRYGVWH